MRYKLIDEQPKTFVLVFETNDELAEGLKHFASEQKLASANFKAIGALSSVSAKWWSTAQARSVKSATAPYALALAAVSVRVASTGGEASGGNR